VKQGVIAGVAAEVRQKEPQRRTVERDAEGRIVAIEGLIGQGAARSCSSRMTSSVGGCFVGVVKMRPA
jgi:hypothetical protein